VYNDSYLTLRVLFRKAKQFRNFDHSRRRRKLWLAVFTLPVALLSAISSHSTAQRQAGPASVQTAVFKGRTSSGWIDFTPRTNFGIHLPVKVNNHDGMALLYGGPSQIDKNLVALLDLSRQIESGGHVNGIEVQLGDLTVQNASATPDDLQRQGYDAKILGHSVLFRLGEELFNQVAVDIDYLHHRVAQTPIALIPDSEVPPASITGGVGLPAAGWVQADHRLPTQSALCHPG
jgi:hypothetical protein